jgi:hypothetical protein
MVGSWVTTKITGTRMAIIPITIKIPVNPCPEDFLETI